MPSPSELTFVAIQAALNAGTLLRRGFDTEFEIKSKDGMQNLVTEYDKFSEQSIISSIFQHFPDHAILAEESGDIQRGKSPITWIIDPLDGTVNFTRNIPVFSVSIAVAVDQQIVSGVVYQPITQELFFAEKDKGAYLNGKRINVSTISEFENALMATGFPYNVDENPLSCIDRFCKMQAQGIPLRRLGSAALDLCYVAAGKFDAFWEVGLNPWDMAAGKLLVEEAGGQVSHWDGSPHKIFCYDTLLSSNGILHQKMIEQLK
jgi:myo-inositol-1(or 4)-monophosphatase